jgi:hypothetical protein
MVKTEAFIPGRRLFFSGCKGCGVYSRAARIQGNTLYWVLFP